MVEESILTGGLMGPGDLPSHNVQIANLFQYMAAVQVGQALLLMEDDVYTLIRGYHAQIGKA